MKVTKSYLISFLALLLGCATLHAQRIVYDTLCVHNLSFTGTSRQVLHDIKRTSGAVYSLKANPYTDNFSLSNSYFDCLVTTSSPGKVKQVIIKFNKNNTGNNRSLDLYAKNSPYKADDVGKKDRGVYSNQPGDLLANFSDGQGKKYQFEIKNASYSSIGICPKKGTNVSYVDTIFIAWQIEGTTDPQKVLPAPTFDLDSLRSYEGAQRLSIKVQSGCEVYYTTDGTLPTTSSKKYRFPIVLTDTTTVKAMAHQVGYQDSQVTVATYRIHRLFERFYKVQKAEDLVHGGKYLIVCDSQKSVMAGDNSEKKVRWGVSCKPVDGVLNLSTDSIASMANPSVMLPHLITLHAMPNNKWKLYDSLYPGYLSAPQDKNVNKLLTIPVSDANRNFVQATISVDAKSNISVDFVIEPSSDLHSYRLLAYGKDRFNCYRSSSSADSIQFYRREKMTNTFTISNAEHATYCFPHSFIMPAGVKGGVVMQSDDPTTFLIDYCYNPQDTVPAFTALILNGKPGEYTYEFTDENIPGKTGNLLYGSTNAQGLTCVDSNGEYCYYKLSYDNNGANLGFYWAEPEGAPFKNGMHKAYLALSRVQASHLKGGFSLVEMDDVSNVDSLTISPLLEPVVYTLDGRRIQCDDLQSLPRGIYIINGNKRIIQ